MAMRVTTKDIARICGVSRGSVDRALHDKPGISPHTRDRILRVSQDLGYRVDLLARGLVKGRTSSIGVVVFDLAHEFFAELVSAIMDCARTAGYFAYVALSGKDRDEETRALDRLAGLNVDCLIILPVGKGRDFERYLSGLNRPLVSIANRLSGKWPFVGLDDRKATHEAVLYIASRGYDRIVYVSPPLGDRKDVNLYTVEQRYLGCKDALRETLGLNRLEVLDTHEYLAAIDGLDLRRGRTAFMCHSDIFALKILRHLTARGFKVPDAAGVMGFDNIDTLQFVRPSLATVDFRIQEIGRRAFECLLDRINGDESAPAVVVEHQIVHGESV
jgi:LacI family transcriptional regulator